MIDTLQSIGVNKKINASDHLNGGHCGLITIR